MPTIKTERSELYISVPEWKRTLTHAQTVASWLAAWLAFDCIFGKRRDEICRLIRKNVWTENGFLFVRFYVGKKKHRTALIDQMPYLKKKTLQHYATHYILDYLKEFDEVGWPETSYLFPSSRHEAVLKVQTKFHNREGQEQTKQYQYIKTGGYRSGQNVYYWIKKVNPNIWPHLGRHTVATKVADSGGTEYEVAAVLDISPRTAAHYVHHGTARTEAWSQRPD